MSRSPVADALILGAGPAGSSAAAVIARAGFKTVLVDRYSFPRDKVCGDALIPDALAAVKELGLDKVVESRARLSNTVRIYAPNGTHVSLAGKSACLPRRDFDDILRRTAVSEGALFLSPANIKHVLRADNLVTGAVIEDRQIRELREIRARITVLATGAGVEGLTRLRVAQRVTPTAIALRAYFRVPNDISACFDHLCISYHKATAPGYGWIFPGPHNVFNVGVGYFIDGVRGSPNRALLWNAFTREFEPAVELLRGSTQISPLKGAPLRTGMSGALLWRPGLLVAGEAAGLTYSFSGEGIGKAMASGLIAGHLIIDYLSGKLSFDKLGPLYANRLAAFAPRYHAYALAQKWLGRPWFANFIAARARRSASVRTQLEALFNETSEPSKLLSPAGVLRSIFS